MVLPSSPPAPSALPAPPAPSLPCRVCAGPSHAGFALCFCCATLVHQLRMPLAPVVAMVRYRVGDRMHRRLRGYKDAPLAEVRHACADHLADLVATWLTANGPGLDRRFGPWDLVVTVPSSARPGGTPVDALVAQVPDLARRHRHLLVRGPERTGHLQAARKGFEVLPAVDRRWLRTRRAVVFDDSFTTGARAQSAVAALRGVGARVVGVVAVGRVVNDPGTGPGTGPAAGTGRKGAGDPRLD